MSIMPPRCAPNGALRELQRRSRFYKHCGSLRSALCDSAYGFTSPGFVLRKGELKMKSRVICFALLLMSFAVTVKAQERKMKIYISADMEGVVGVVTNEQLGPQGFEYAPLPRIHDARSQCRHRGRI